MFWKNRCLKLIKHFLNNLELVLLNFKKWNISLKNSEIKFRLLKILLKKTLRVWILSFFQERVYMDYLKCIHMIIKKIYSLKKFHFKFSDPLRINMKNSSTFGNYQGNLSITFILEKISKKKTYKKTWL